MRFGDAADESWWENKRSGKKVCMNTMKRILALSAMLLFVSSLAAIAQTAPRHQFTNPLLDDVAQMSSAGLSEATIEAYVQARRSRLSADVTAEDLVRLRDAGVSERVVSYLAGVAGIQGWKGMPPSEPRAEATYDANDSGSESYPVEGAGSYSYPYWYGWGYGYPYWYGWYGYPYYWGGYYYGFGHFHGGHFHGGGGHGGHGGHGGGHGGGHSGGHGGGHGGGHR
jgi:hypothetical protein